MKNFDLNDILSEASLKETKSSGFKYIEAKRIKLNKLNKDRQTNENVDKIRKSIETVGLIHPLKVIKDKDNDYILISGHGRYLALSQMLVYQFNGKTHDAYEIPVIIDETIYTSDDEQLALIVANAQKDESVEEKRDTVKKCERIFLNKKENNHLSEDDIKNKRSWIAAMTGYSESSVRDYLSANKKEEKAEDEVMKPIKKFEKVPAKEIMKLVDKIIEQIENDDFLDTTKEDAANIKKKFQEMSVAYNDKMIFLNHREKDKKKS